MLRLASSASRDLHSLFDEGASDANNQHDNNLWMNNVTDHYHRPAADGGSLGRTEDQEGANDIDSTHNQTLQFVLIFVSFMVLYIGFCMYYRKVKFGRGSYNSYGESPDNATSRQRRQRDNQAVLDESSSAANLAAADGEEHRKLEERKRRIREVLWTKLIVDDEIEKQREDYLVVGDGIEDRFYGDDEGMRREEEKAVAVVTKGRTLLAQDEDAAIATTGTLAKHKEEEEEEVLSNEETTTIATVPSSSEGTIVTIPSNEVVPAIDNSSTSFSTVAPSSPFRKYADALSCSNCHNHATNYCGSHQNICNSSATHQINVATYSSPSGNNDKSPSSTSNNPTSSSLTTITLSDIQQTYGDECNICLSTFQVGDRATWSKHHFNGCVHAFHDECMKRWLLVRDGCPICRRLYLDDGKTMKSVAPAAAPQDDDDDGGVNNDGAEIERDLESGGGNAIITIEEE